MELGGTPPTLNGKSLCPKKLSGMGGRVPLFAEKICYVVSESVPYSVCCFTQVNETAAAHCEQGMRKRWLGVTKICFLCFLFWVRHKVQVLLVGLYKDQDSPLQMLRAPNDVMNDVMPIIWRHLTEQWQVGPKHNLLLREAPSLIFFKSTYYG